MRNLKHYMLHDRKFNLIFGITLKILNIITVLFYCYIAYLLGVGKMAFRGNMILLIALFVFGCALRYFSWSYRQKFDYEKYQGFYEADTLMEYLNNANNFVMK